jgi:hypothetical protein
VKDLTKISSLTVNMQTIPPKTAAHGICAVENRLNGVAALPASKAGSDLSPVETTRK